jgi:hypothetical protein
VLRLSNSKEWKMKKDKEYSLIFLDELETPRAPIYTQKISFMVRMLQGFKRLGMYVP